MARHFRKKQNKKQQVKLPAAAEVQIQSLGVHGDGIARTENGDLFFVPYVLEGETVLVKPIKKRGDGYSCSIQEIITPSVDRIAPSCKHFAECGGCKLQHMPLSDQKDFKKRVVEGALRKQNISTPLNDTVIVGGLRRRARFVAKRAGNYYIGGFHKSQSHAIAPIESCEIVSPAVWDAFQIVLKSLNKLKAPNAVDIHVTEGMNGIEVVMYPHGEFEIDLDAREVLTDVVNEHKFIGLYWFSDTFIDPVCAKDSLKIKFGDVVVGVPPASFLQPSQAGQDVLTGMITTALEEAGTKGRIADLFAGSGCFSFPLTKFGGVDAYEGNAIALNLLNKTASGKGVQGFVRDLELEPLDDDLCSAYKAIILDPPRAGASSQVEKIADSTCPLVVYISCNPIALARDSVTLMDGGYRMTSITPVDQFAHSDHTETVAIFKR